MPTYLTQEWMDLVKKLAQDFPDTPGATVRMQYVVTGVPDAIADSDGEAKYYTVIDNGKTLEQNVGTDDQAEVTLTTSYEDSKKIQQGELDANAAFMQGRVKVTGNMAKVMSLIPLTNRPEYKEIQTKVREDTTYPDEG